MWNCIRMELYKMFRMKSFWVISLITIGLIFATTEFSCEDMKATQQEQSAAKDQEQSAAKGQEQSAAKEQGQGAAKDQASLKITSQQDESAEVTFGIVEDTSDMNIESVKVFDMFLMHLKSGILTMMMLIFAIIYVTADMKNGYIKNIGGQLKHRRQIIYAKWIAIAVYTFVFDLVILVVQSAAVFGTFHYIKWGKATAYLPGILLGIALQYVFLIVCMALAMIIRSYAFGMTLGMALILGVGPLACMGIQALCKRLFGISVDLQPYLMTTKMQSLRIGMSTTEIRNICLLLIGYFVVLSAINILQIEKRDLV